jgi:tetraacyldisaccharide 4'-kinase
VNFFLRKAWIDRGWRARLLWPIAQIYTVAFRIRQFLFFRGLLQATKFDRPVVVVGNVVAGGAGKTPLVIALVQYLTAHGLNAGVVSRGYGRSGEHLIEVLYDTPIEESGDEPALVKRATGAPVFVASKRVAAVEAMLAAHPDLNVVIADDGLQHYALARDIEVVVFDDRGTGNGWLLPAGPLREPWPRKRHAATTLILHTGLKPAFEGFTSTRALARYAVAANGGHVPLETLRGRPITAVAAIAHPEAFFDMLRLCGLILERTFSWPDHHDFADFHAEAFSGQIVLCTEKDAVKLFGDARTRTINLLAVPLMFSPEASFFSAFDSALSKAGSPVPSSNGYQTS